MPKKQPYIGVTGFMSPAEVAACLACIPAESPSLFMVGVLVSDKSIRGMASNPNRFAAIEQITGIFVPNKQVLNMLHYNTHTIAGQITAEELSSVYRLGGEHCNGLQLNMVWPNPNEIYKLKKMHPEMQIILQVGATAYAKVGNNPIHAVRYIYKFYKELVDYVLFDMSGGTGKAMPTIVVEDFLAECLAIKLHLVVGLGVAGGLDATSLPNIAGLVRANKVSIDAEGKLRDSADTLDIAKATAYIQKALRYSS